MAKSDRLFRTLHLLRTLPRPVTAEQLADALDVSLRTVYRDIAALRAGGALIDGEAGFGYSLTEDPALPPQMFSRIEVEALVLGLAEVRQSGDHALADAAEAALAKIVASLPERVQRQAAHAVLQVHRLHARPPASPAMDLLRQACWDETAVDISYRDNDGVITRRRVWPLSIALLDHSRMLLAWCCLRQAFRRFHIHNMSDLSRSGESFRPRRVPLLRAYMAELIGERAAQPGQSP